MPDTNMHMYGREHFSMLASGTVVTGIKTPIQSLLLQNLVMMPTMVLTVGRSVMFSCASIHLVDDAFF